jgi:ribosomal protein S18 acetylase RimI-like enzyme
MRAYSLDGLLDDDSDYAKELRDAAHRAAHADLLVAVDEDGAVLGTVTFCLPGSPYAELSRDGQAEFRMLAVEPSVRGRGVGEKLVRACLDRAEGRGCTSVVISTRPQMLSAHRIYQRLHFKRTPELDWTPAPGIDLITYTRTLA